MVGDLDDYGGVIPVCARYDHCQHRHPEDHDQHQRRSQSDPMGAHHLHDRHGGGHACGWLAERPLAYMQPWDTPGTLQRSRLASVSLITGDTIMATIERRTSKEGYLVYRVKVRRRGAPRQTATFSKLSEARKWAQV